MSTHRTYTFMHSSGCSQFISNIFFYEKINTSKTISGSNGPIFTKFSPYGSYLIVDCRFDPFFRWPKKVAVTTYFKIKIDKIGLFTFIRIFDIPK